MGYKFNPFSGKLDSTGPEVTALNTLGVKADLATIQAIVGPSVGDVWQADDTDIFYLWDGSAWVSLGTLGTAGPTGPTGPAGADGSTILSGSGAPVDNVTGSDGDFYIDTAAHTIYGPRTAGAWGVGTSLVAGGATTLGGLTDVDLATTPPTDGQALVYDNASGDWIPGSAGATAAGSANEIQYNDGASGLAASADLTWDNTAKELGVGGDLNLDSGGSFSTIVQSVTPTANRTISFPDQTGTVGLVSGATGNIQYNNAGQLAGTGDLNADLNWTDAGVTYTGLKVNVTDTASAAGSNVLDLQVNGSSEVRYTPSETSLGGGAGQAIYTPLVNVRKYFGSAFIYNGANVSNGLKIGQSTSGYLDISSSDLGVRYKLINGSAYLTTDAGDVFAQRNGTNAQTYRLYNTYTDASNYERIKLGWESNVFRIGVESDGTGNKEREIRLTVDDTTFGDVRQSRLRITPEGSLVYDRADQPSTTTGVGHFLFGNSNSSSSTGLSKFAFGANNDVTFNGSFQFAYGWRAKPRADHMHATGVGDANNSQYGHINYFGTTTDATTTEITSGDDGDRLTIPANVTTYASIVVVARSDGGADHASFERKILLENTGGTTAEVTTVQIGTEIGSNGGSPPTGWGVTVSADDTVDALKIEVTGAAATNITWIARIEYTEVYNA